MVEGGSSRPRILEASVAHGIELPLEYVGYRFAEAG